jgi:hypothetical protein
LHLREAADSLARVIREIEADPEYSEGELGGEMEHLYHHVNTAWNARTASAERAAACSLEDFRDWRQFPADIDMAVADEAG